MKGNVLADTPWKQFRTPYMTLEFGNACRETRVGHFYLYVPEWIQTEQGRKKKKKEKRQEKEHNEQTNNIEV